MLLNCKQTQNSRMSKKQLRADIEAKLSTALGEYSKDISDKKFKKHIKKAAKILGDGLAKPAEKKAAVPKKETPPKKEAAPVKKSSGSKKAAAPKKAKAPAKKAAPKKVKKAPAKKVVADKQAG